MALRSTNPRLAARGDVKFKVRQRAAVASVDVLSSWQCSRSAACSGLLASRVDPKHKKAWRCSGRGTAWRCPRYPSACSNPQHLQNPRQFSHCDVASSQGKRVADVTNRMHVALPKPRDGVARPPVIPPSVLAAQTGQAPAQAAARKLQKEVQVCGWSLLPQAGSLGMRREHGGGCVAAVRAERSQTTVKLPRLWRLASCAREVAAACWE